MNTTNSTATQSVDLLTAAYIGYGLRTALANDLTYNGDDFNGESGLMDELVSNAPALDAEWQRRYGVDGIEPNGGDFVFYYEIAEPFGEKFAIVLATDRHAKPDGLIKMLFDQADPHFTEPDPVSGPDIPAITKSIRSHVLDKIMANPDTVNEIVERGFTGLNNRTDEELVAMYEHLFNEEVPQVSTGSAVDPELRSAA